MNLIELVKDTVKRDINKCIICQKDQTQMKPRRFK